MDSTEERTSDGALTIGMRHPIHALNPYIGRSNEAHTFYSLVYDFLFSVDEDQNYVPNIAAGASTADGGRTWVYQIRQGVRWHDRTDLTAEDVAFTVNYNIQAFPLLWAYEPYLNQVTPCAEGKTSGCGAQVTGPWEVTVYFDIPFAPGGSAMAFPILQKAQWQSISPSQAQYSYSNANPIGTGPYKADPNIYQQWLNGDPLVLHANPDYHFGAPKVQRIVFRHFADENSMVAALFQGDIDVAMLGAAGADVVRLASRPGIDLQEGLTVLHYWIDIGITQLNHPGVNLRLNPARFDLSVRQAMAHATNKTFIVEQFYRGKGIPGTTMVSPVTPFWHYEPTAEETYGFDLDAANAILDAAGYDAFDTDGVRKASRDMVLDVYCSPENVARGCVTSVTVPAGQRLSFSMVTRLEPPEEREIALNLREVWRTVGIELNPIITEEERSMIPDVYGGEFDTYIWWWSADPDPNYILSIQSNFTLNGWNDNYFDNESYNRLYLQQLSAMDPNERRALVHEALKVHYLAANFIILVNPFFHYAWWTDEYAGWGDPVAHPGRQIEARWGAHPLFLALEPVGPSDDMDAPMSLAAVSGTEGENGWYVSPITVTLTASDAGSGLAGIRYRLNGGAWQEYDAPFTISVSGEHLLEYQAEDFAGNLEALRSETVRTDLDPPSFLSMSRPRVVTTASVTIHWEAVDATSGIAQYEVSLDGAPVGPVGSATSVNLSLVDGTHTVRVRAVDVAGNWAEETATFQVDTNIFSLTGPQGGAPAFVLISLGAVVIVAVVLWRRAHRRMR